MSATMNLLETDNSIGRRGGVIWNRLHSEREDICEELSKEPVPASEGSESAETTTTAFWHQELLQSRLRKIDDALDRLMSGSYGNCSKCGRWIEDSKLDFDAAVAFCLECWERLQTAERSTNRASETHEMFPAESQLEHLTDISPSVEGIMLETLAPFDTIYVNTLNSDYRIFLLDPSTGRAILEGGRFFPEPVEVTISGSTFGGSTFKRGWIGIEMRIEVRANGKLASTSPVQSFRVEHPLDAD